MAETYRDAFKKFSEIAEQVIEEGASLLEDYLYYGDWTLLIIRRKVLEKTELSDEEQDKLNQIDKSIGNSFTFRLLVEYAELYPEIIKFWANKEDEEKHLNRLVEIIYNSIHYTDENCTEYETFARHLIQQRKDKNKNKDSWDELEKTLKAYNKKISLQ